MKDRNFVDLQTLAAKRCIPIKIMAKIKSVCKGDICFKNGIGERVV